MPDKQLQQYAMLHKNDPYILSLAVQESNARKQIRASSQMQAPQQPPVADQDIAQMAPQGMGVAALPAQNMEQMADGGIAGYADDGEVPRFNGSKSQFVQDIEALGSYLTPFSKERMDRIRAEDAAKAAAEKATAAQRAAQIESGRPRTLAASLSNYFTSPNAKMQEAESYLPAAPQAPTEQAVVQAAQSAKASGASPPAPNMETLDQQRPPAPPAPPAPAAPAAGLPTLATKMPTAEEAVQQAGKFVDFSKAESELGTMRARQRMSDEALIKTYEDTKPKTPAYQGLEAMLDKESKETATEKDKAGLWALFNGFLAMAGGESPHALTNIAKGALQGSAEYSAAMKDIKKIERENMKMRADIEQARRAESRDDQKTLLGLQKDISDRQAKIDELGVGLVSKISGTTAEVASNIFSTGVKEANQNLRTQMQVNAQQAQSPMAMYQALGAAQPGSSLLKGYELSKEADKLPMLYKMYTTSEADQLKGGEFKARYPTFEAYLAGMGGIGGTGGGFVQPPANATILNAPKK
jgi:hypothetical protein